MWISPLKRARMFLYPDYERSTAPRNRLDCQSVKNRLCCVEHKIDPHPGLLAASCIKRSSVVIGSDERKHEGIY